MTGAPADTAVPPASGGGAAGRSGRGRPRHIVWLLIGGIALAAVNLRTGITSVGPLLTEVTSGLGMSAVLAGVLTTLPVLCFALFGALTPVLIRRLGEHRLLAVALVALTIGLSTRPLVEGALPFLALSAIALSGGAVGNVLLPTLVKQHFPDRVGAMTTVYTTFLALGTTMAAAATVPVEQASGSWRLALGCYGAFGLLAAVPWLALLRHNPPRAGGAAPIGLGHVLKTAMGWQSVLFFGTQSTIAYIMFGWYAEMLRDQGMGAAQAGLMLSYLTALAVPLSLVLPGLMARVRDHRAFVVFFFVCYAIGLTGLWVSPLQGTWVWTTLIGLGMATFTLALTFFAVRTRTSGATAAMSASSQSIGYLMAGSGPFLFGMLHELTGGWHAPLVLVVIMVTANLVVGLWLGRPRYLEDSLPGEG